MNVFRHLHPAPPLPIIYNISGASMGRMLTSRSLSPSLWKERGILFFSRRMMSFSILFLERERKAG